MDLNIGIARWVVGKITEGSGARAMMIENGRSATIGDDNEASAGLTAMIFGATGGPLPVGRVNPDPCLSAMNTLSAEFFLHICDSLSLRDILALRSTNKHFYRLTHTTHLFSALLRRLTVIPPILPATSRNLFGAIRSGTYESLLRRAVYLTHNWSSTLSGPIADKLIAFDAYNRVSQMKWLPGGKYLLTTTRNLSGRDKYIVSLWDVEKGAGLMRVGATNEPGNLRVRYVNIKGQIYIVFSCTIPMAPREDGAKRTRVQVIGIALSKVEDLSDSTDRDQFLANAEDARDPFEMLHDVVIDGNVVDVDMAEMNGQLLISFIVAPRTLVFTLFSAGFEEPKTSVLALGETMSLPDIRNAAWKLKLLPWQNAVMVARLLVPENEISRAETTLFTLDMYQLPAWGEKVENPDVIGRHFLTGVNILAFEFSDLESTWFSAVKTEGALLNTKSNEAPPPISIFATTKDPAGFIHLTMPPLPVPNSSIPLSNGMKSVPQFVYQLPAESIGRQTWTDHSARPTILPGAYRTLMYTRPRVRPTVDFATTGMEVQRLFAYRTMGESVPVFSGPRSTGWFAQTTPIAAVDAEGQAQVQVRYVEEEVELSAGQEEEEEAVDENMDPNVVLKVPRFTDLSVVEEMKRGMTAMAYDESTGRVCYAVVEDTRVRLLDFGKPLSEGRQTREVEDVEMQ
ncbi:hypothetical protein M422DRAFT_37917 [Sphaerobolus stellatus SS14]|uniref:Unplaced genomic scaffold SPHSTscaffold_269, whole genome shotgun sequence n=1 Tax=Sphaerobolus stellatus (strain SS14) TaxID=990650 RepID=A0A0C9UNY3_SPHS4|nr:hypothetical protein M422DRAFT_37917 [Sphaerobolus stellatus SS14]